ncbi:MAG: adenylate/guanylate cyclase domain-containing protein [Actinomycetota bacterium]
MWKRLISSVARWGGHEGDTEQLARAKSFLVLTALLIDALSVFWVLLYWQFGEPLAAAIPGGYIVLSLISIAVFARTRRFGWFRDSQLALFLILPTSLQLVLGGFVNASAVVLWSLIAPLGALIYTSQRVARAWFIGYLAVVLLSGLVQPWIPAENNLPMPLVLTFFIMNFSAVSLVVFFLMSRFVRQLHAERAKSDGLLLNILPARIGDRLRENPGQVIAERFESASVLFADVVGFTPISAGLSPEELVEVLDAVFSDFDSLADKHGVEKIKTIGDSYMAAAGVPIARPDHAQAVADLALDIQRYCESYPLVAGSPLRIRVGINSGPLVAGVIGRRKFIYDLWGDTVNTASRMEAHGEPGSIQLTEASYQLLKDEYHCVPHGIVDVKGKGPMPTWFLVGAL